MSLARRVCLMWMLAGLAAAAHSGDATPSPGESTSAADAASTQPALDADDELLEFLGSIDTDDADEDWLDYLARTDIVKVAKAKKKMPDATEVKK